MNLIIKRVERSLGTTQEQSTQNYAGKTWRDINMSGENINSYHSEYDTEVLCQCDKYCPNHETSQQKSQSRNSTYLSESHWEIEKAHSYKTDTNSELRDWIYYSWERYYNSSKKTIK